MRNEHKIKEIYRRDLAGVGFLDEEKSLLADQLAGMELIKGKTAAVPMRRNWASGRAATAFGLGALLLGICFGGTGVLKALELQTSPGIFYTKVTHGGTEMSLVDFQWDKWNVRMKRTGAAASEWQEAYPELWQELAEEGAADILLPCYHMGEYTAERIEAFVRFDERKGGEKEIGFLFRNGDSRIYMTANRNYSSDGSAFTGRIKEHYCKSVNGVFYEVMVLDENYTREEYEAARKASLGERYTAQSEEEFEDYRKRNAAIVCAMQNDWEYSFSLTEDIDVEEFLESIR